MTLRLVPMTDDEVAARTEAATGTEAGVGALATEAGNLPLVSLDAAVRLTGLVGRMVITQGFCNPHDVPLEATYIFPLPDRWAVTAMRMTAADRVIDAQLKERGQAREEYERAVAEGRRASIAEEERPDVFTIRVGNILAGERVSVSLTLVGPLSYEDGEATFRLPLVVAPRYIPGTPLDGAGVGDGYALDTDAVPDASRITPPVLLKGFPNPVRLTIGVDIDPAGLPLGEVRSSLHAVVREGDHLRILPGERVNRDFIVRLAYATPDTATHSLTLTPDAGQQEDQREDQQQDQRAGQHEGTFRLTILPPASSEPPKQRDVVLLLDRSGSMQGWKMVAARRAAARIVETLTGSDRFAVLTFDHTVEQPPGLPDALVAATDRHRYRAVEHLARVDARGGTELLAPLDKALTLLRETRRERVLVLVTDGQVGNEDQILASTAKALTGVRVHTVGIDQAVNAGFLGRLAAVGGGRCELVESEDRLDDAMDRIHRRIGAPVVHGLAVRAEGSKAGGLEIVEGTVAPGRLPDLFPGVPLVVAGRYRGIAGALTVSGHTADGAEWSVRVDAVTTDDPSATAVWARAHLRDLEDRYASGEGAELEQEITRTSLRFGVLCRFTAWLAVDSRVVAGREVHRVVQPVEPVSGWDMQMQQAAPAALMPAAAPMAFMLPQPAPPPRGRGGAAGFIGRAVRLMTEARDGARATAQEATKEKDPVAAARAQAATEAARLRAARNAPLRERRELLADLGTRLEAMVRHVAGSDGLAPVRRIVEEITADRPLTVPTDVFEDLWARTLRALDEVAGVATRRAFWKRDGG
jgi:Ca-activated chloride channel homolog